MKTVHLVFNAHLDPIWLWPWQSGLDELLNTCRTAADLLDRHPDLIFTRGEAWVYRHIERLEPALFLRIQKLVKEGRWEIVGGWWIQPDCNVPGATAFAKQIELGREYFLSRFGFFPEIGYNVDSFGHAATLPEYLTAAGQKYYVMMRPGDSEKKLPARLFHWRGHAGGPEVMTFRIAGSYNARDMTIEHVQKALSDLPPGVEHTMCFVGVGDHGGGPTEKQIQWCREHVEAVPGARLVISSPSRFFKAIAATNSKLPGFTGDLQCHAIGCYSVHRPVKKAMSRAEHLLNQAEFLRGQLGEKAPYLPDLRRGWEQVCFHHFHDTLCGTCIPSAYVQILDQLGEASSLADETLQVGMRALVADMPADPLQRLVYFNPSKRAFSGYVEMEPWIEWRPWQGTQVIDEKGKVLPHQTLHSEALVNGLTRILFRLDIPAGGTRVLRLRRGGKIKPSPVDTIVRGRQMRNRLGVIVRSGARSEISFGSLQFRPELELREDLTDTWSHDADGFAGRVTARSRWNVPEVLDRGPLMTSFLQTGTISRSQIQSEYRVYAGLSWVDLRLRIHWMERQKILKLVLRRPDFGAKRIDGIMGGKLSRSNDGKELPFQNWTLLSLDRGRLSLGIVCPDINGLDATPDRAALTLLRSPLLSHHNPNPGTYPRGSVADQGVHDFRFKFRLGKGISPAALEHEAFQMQEPPLVVEATKGMPTRWAEYFENTPC